MLDAEGAARLATPVGDLLQPGDLPFAFEADRIAGGEVFPDLDWFDALTLFKEAALTSLLIKRAEKSGDPGIAAQLVEFTPSLGRMLDTASEKLAG